MSNLFLRNEYLYYSRYKYSNPIFYQCWSILGMALKILFNIDK